MTSSSKPNILQKIYNPKTIHDELCSNLSWSSACDVIEKSIILQDFLIEKFEIKKSFDQFKKNFLANKLIYDIRVNFVQRYALKKYSISDVTCDIGNKLNTEFGISELISDELFCRFISDLGSNDSDRKEILAKFAVWACRSKEGRAAYYKSAIFSVPEKIDNGDLLNQDIPPIYRHDFNLYTEKKITSKIYSESNYCLHCHQRDKDSCRSGLHENGQIKINQLGVSLSGCPMDQKISEMIMLASRGEFIAAIAVAMIDNPFLILTGDRICNDCKKSCIFQLQTPVDIPSIETWLIETLLQFKWGFEIYYLLTAWNPLISDIPLQLPNKNKSILVCGLGPAGMAMSYYMSRLGYSVLAVDGLTMDNVDKDYVRLPIEYFYDEVSCSLEDKKNIGFGGVMEYGITARWDKNMLLAMKIILNRNKNFFSLGGVRFGSQLKIGSVFDSGFCYIALAIGCGPVALPNIANLDHNDVFLSSDFLMTIHNSTNWNKGIRGLNFILKMPIVVIGGGLTSIDCATEAITYYIKQMEIFDKISDSDLLQAGINQSDIDVFKNEYSIFKKIKRKSERVKYIRSNNWVNVVYRKDIKKSPAYALNHEEINYAIAQGVGIIDDFDFKDISFDQDGNISAVVGSDGVLLNASSVIIATGTKNNLSPIFDHIESEISETKGEYSIFNDNNDFSVYYNQEGKSVGIFGDMNPKYRGSVVKALASVKNSHKKIDQIITASSGISRHGDGFMDDFIKKLTPTVNEIKKHRNGKVELSIKFESVQKSEPGDIFRLRTMSQKCDYIPITLISHNKNQNILNFVIWKKGLSTSQIAKLKQGDKVSLMGPVSGLAKKLKYKDTLIIHTKESLDTAIGIGDLIESKSSGKVELIDKSEISADFKYNYHQIIVLYDEDLANSIKLSSDKDVLLIPAKKMNCMMKGVCGRCLKYDEKKKQYRFLCADYAIET